MKGLHKVLKVVLWMYMMDFLHNLLTWGCLSHQEVKVRGIFCDKDVCKALGQEHLNDDEKKALLGVGPNSEPGHHEGKAVYISESGLCSLVLKSKLLTASSLIK